MMDSYLPYLLAIVIGLNFVMFTAQLASNEIADSLGKAHQNFYDSQNSLLCKADKANCQGTNYTLADENPLSQLPRTEAVETETGIFTDIFNSIWSWATDTLSSIPGVSYVSNIVSAPGKFIINLGLPDAFGFAVASMWYLFSVFILIAFVWGR